MAKLKEKKEIVGETAENTELQASPAQTIEAEDQKAETQNEAEAPQKAEARKEEQIPAKVLELLKVFNDSEELYIDDKGGVYSKDTCALWRGSAVLYKNPFFKK